MTRLTITAAATALALATGAPPALATQMVSVQLTSQTFISDSGPNASASYSDAERTGSSSISDANGSMHAYAESHPMLNNPGSNRIVTHGAITAPLQYVGPEATLTFFADVEGSFFDSGGLGAVSMDSSLSALDILGNPNDSFTFGSQPGVAGDSGAFAETLSISFDVANGQIFRIVILLDTVADFTCSLADNVCGTGFMDLSNSLTAFVDGLPDSGTLTPTDGSSFVFQSLVEDDTGGTDDVPAPAGLPLLVAGLAALAFRLHGRAAGRP